MAAKRYPSRDVSYRETPGILEQMQPETSFVVCFLRGDVVHMGERLCRESFIEFVSLLKDAEKLRHECNYLHRLPLPNRTLIVSRPSTSLIPLIWPDQLLEHSRDCFGREKHAEYRDDMGGVGSFNRSNRTLYIAKMQESPDKKQTEETLLRHFGEWGKIVKCQGSFLHSLDAKCLPHTLPHHQRPS